MKKRIKKSFKKPLLLFLALSFLSLIFSSALYTNCANTPFANPGPSYSAALPITQGQGNVLPINVGCGYVNEPCVTVVVCIPGTSQCQTIPNVLLDTGSYGLRLFSNITNDGRTTTPLLSLPLTPYPHSRTKTLAECVSYGDDSSTWGPIATADIQLGGESAAAVPVQVINSSFAQIPSDCENPDSSPILSGFNGILGVGVFAQDCGSMCDPALGGTDSNGIYYKCSSGGCSDTGVALAMQVTNPVALLPVDNNGVVVALTANVPSTGASSLGGWLVFGIGTQNNNSPAGTTTFQTDASGSFSTLFNGTIYSSSFIDSGSNALYFPQGGGLPVCGDDASFYCPASEVTLPATQNAAWPSATTSALSFSVYNADWELSPYNSNKVFNNLAGTYNQFDWGFPFFLGRNIFVGIEGQSSSAGTGTYWAY